MNLYYSPKISFPLTELDENESHHCVKVLRQMIGDNILITDGLGVVYQATITLAHAKHCQVMMGKEFSRERTRKYRLHMAVAPTKSFDRFEWMLEKLTEIGVDEITPLICDNSERDKLNSDRCRKVLLSAMKQCQSGFIPVFHEAVSFKKFCLEQKEKHIWMAHCREVEKQSLDEAITKSKDITILIGPEGDFSLKEIEWAASSGIQGLHLGYSRLRTETAAIYAATGINVLAG